MSKLFTTLCALLITIGAVNAQTYTDRHEVYQSVSTGVNSTQKALNSLVAQNEIQRGGTAHYVAGKSVTLQPGFVAQAGSVFEATVATVSSARLSSEGDNKLNVTAYPNPFSDVVSISYSLPEASTVKQTLTDEQGRLIRQTGGIDIEKSGTHDLRISGQTMPTGIYFLQLQTATDQKVIRLLKK